MLRGDEVGPACSLTKKARRRGTSVTSVPATSNGEVGPACSFSKTSGDLLQRSAPAAASRRKGTGQPKQPLAQFVGFQTSCQCWSAVNQTSCQCWSAVNQTSCQCWSAVKRDEAQAPPISRVALVMRPNLLPTFLSPHLVVYALMVWWRRHHLLIKGMRH